MTVSENAVSNHQHPIWAEVDLSAIAHNVRALRKMSQGAKHMLVAVKANGYGHGAVAVARTALENGATDLGVARIQEGIALRHAGISAPILIFGPTPAAGMRRLIENALTPTVISLADAMALSDAAVALGKSIEAQIKIDSGMGRLGLPCEDLRLPDGTTTAETVSRICALEGLAITGIYTHFATADHADKTYADQQFQRFETLIAKLADNGIHIPLRHAANSGAIMEMPQTHLEMVRAGISIYGLYPSGEVDRSLIALRPAMRLKARIIHLKQVPAGTAISYGCTYRTTTATTIATIPAGYADGYNRRLSNNGDMLVHGQRAPIAGRVCMDLTMIDVGRISNVQVGDEVVLMGRQGDETISADEIADRLGTINYEVVSTLSERVPRLYLE